MGWMADADGITIKKLFSKRTIPYTDIKSIRKTESNIIFTLKDGDEITLVSSILSEDNIYPAIKKLNIAFVDENEETSVDKTYTIDEVNEKIELLKSQVYDLLAAPIKSKYGLDHDVEVKVKDEGDYIDMYFTLLRNGKPVQFFEGFDDMVIAYLVRWDQDMNCGRYGLTVEAKCQSDCVKTVQEILIDLYERYKM